MATAGWCALLTIFFIYCFRDIKSGSIGLEAIPERADITFINSKYVENCTVNVRKYNRKGSYVANVAAVLKQSWTNNVSVDVIMYEYLHNEYKRSFVEFHFKVCDLIDKDQYIGSLIRKYGYSCPIPTGYHQLANMTIKFPKFPYVFPFQKCKAEMTLKTEPAHEMISRWNVYFTMKQNKND